VRADALEPDRRYTALQHSLTCTPLVHDFEWSSILLRASADPIAALNHRTRYGTTAAHEQVMSYNRPGEEDIRGQALEFVLARGANVDIVDHEGSTCRNTATRCQLFMEIIEDFDEMFEQDGGCRFCRRGGTIGGGVEGNGKGVAVAPGTQGPTLSDKNGIRANLRCGRCRGVMCEFINLLQPFNPHLLLMERFGWCADCSRNCQKFDWWVVFKDDSRLRYFLIIAFYLLQASTQVRLPAVRPGGALMYAAPRGWTQVHEDGGCGRGIDACALIAYYHCRIMSASQLVAVASFDHVRRWPARGAGRATRVGVAQAGLAELRSCSAAANPQLGRQSTPQQPRPDLESTSVRRARQQVYPRSNTQYQ